MRIAFITAPRVGVSYLEASIESCLMDPSVCPGDIAVFSDSVERPDGVPEGVRVEVRSAEYVASLPPAGAPTELISRAKKAMSMGRNMVRATRWVSEVGEFGAVFEDDVVFAKSWQRHALAVAEAAKAWSPEFALTLLQFYPRDLDFGRGLKAGVFEVLKWDNIDKYYGSQATLYTQKAGLEIAEWRERRIEWAEGQDCIKQYDQVGDFGLKYGLMALKLPLFSVYPNLVQHTGDVSTLFPERGSLVAPTFYAGE